MLGAAVLREATPPDARKQSGVALSQRRSASALSATPVADHGVSGPSSGVASSHGLLAGVHQYRARAPTIADRARCPGMTVAPSRRLRVGDGDLRTCQSYPLH